MVARLGGQDERTLVATGRERECGTVDQATGSNESFHAEMLQHGGNVEEREFLTLADAELNRIEQVLERLQEDSDADWDFEIKPGGILELDFADASKIIINRHVAAREIWVAAKSGGFHFKPPTGKDGHWLDTRDGRSLADLLSACISAQSGVLARLDW
jgi:CyaY protein